MRRKKEVTIGEVVEYLDERFRPELQEGYDNAGFLMGERTAEYRGVLVALDLTEAVVSEAEALGLNLIVTHHPFFFGGLKRVTDETERGRIVMRLVRGGISVYAAHTNLDNVAWGVSGELASRLGLRGCRVLVPASDVPEEKEEAVGAGIVGELPRMMSVEMVLERMKHLLGVPTLRVSRHDGERRVRRVAVCGGSGRAFIGAAEAAGAEMYLTADLKYHDFESEEGGMIVVDGGHYETEQFAKEIISGVISEKFCNFAVRISQSQASLVLYI